MSFERSVFINCPFDNEYDPILQSILFVVIAFGFDPKIASGRNDNSDARLDKIVNMIKGSKYAIHDISRCSMSISDFITEDKKINKSPVYARLNMPFELGIDYGFKKGTRGILSQKKMLVMESSQRDYLASISDIRAWDIRYHSGQYRKAMKIARDWLVSEAAAPQRSFSELEGKYVGFQEWRLEKGLSDGFSEEEILTYPTFEVVRSMKEWKMAGEPDSYS
jgi:hypothetical protein